MDQAQTAHDPFAEWIILQFRDYQPFFIADNDVFHIASAVDEDAYLAAKIAGQFDKADSQIMGAEFGDGHTPAV
jgi:hypothetical protein